MNNLGQVIGWVVNPDRPHVLIDDWKIRQLTPTPYDAPELTRFALYGKVYGHPMHTDGTYVTTSEVQGAVDLETGQAETRNTIYRLGMPNEGYVQWCKENGYTKILEFIDKVK